MPDGPAPDGAAFATGEKALSTAPALDLLRAMGWTMLTPAQATAQRRGRTSSVLLQDILAKQLAALNRIRTRTGWAPFSEANIAAAVEKMRGAGPLGLLRANEVQTDLLLLGAALPQTVEGDTRSHTLRYVDWDNSANNTFHAVPEFAVARSRSAETYVPDIVLFVNGIPFGVIEAKAPDVVVGQAISQHLRNQQSDGIPSLFHTVQVLAAINRNDARAGTVGTAAKFWARWRTDADEDQAVQVLTGREPTEQDRLLHALFEPGRLLDVARRFTLFDGGEKKIARYQQVAAVKRILARARAVGPDGKRAGGVIWHTQGSGKSLTMVMLARALGYEPGIPNPRIVLVTDRVDLDKQLTETFRACHLGVQRAPSGRGLLEMVAGSRGLISSTLQKFRAALQVRDHQDLSPDVFLLVDESHRSQSGDLHAGMRRVFPNACYVGFTGTPLLKREKSTFLQFGDLIDRYDMRQAVQDGQVVPLLYEGRLVEQEVNRAGVDAWFGRTTAALLPDQVADLKRRFSRMAEVNQSSQTIACIAFDVSRHFAATFQGATPFKAQLVAPTKRAAIAFKKALDDLGQVSSEVIISGPDTREGHETVEDDTTDEVLAFWCRMIERYGSEEEYVERVTEAFKKRDDPEILIVVSKLLTGFDVPRNAVLYIAKSMKDHELLQAIARVNRLHDGKEHGLIIDYQGLLGALDKALTDYDALAGYDAADIADVVSALRDEVANLPQRHAELLDLFRDVPPPKDEEAYERHLADDERRQDFYARLSAFSKALHTALGSAEFSNDPANAVALRRYKDDLRRFYRLRGAVRHRYEAAGSTADLEPRIRKLLDQHVTAHEVVGLTPQVDIFDDEAFAAALQAQGTPAAKADTIASQLKRTLTERMEEDPALYRRFSEMIEQAIAGFREGRLRDLDYLARMRAMQEDVAQGRGADVPSALREAPDAAAFYRVAEPVFAAAGGRSGPARDAAAAFGLAAVEIVGRHRAVNWTEDLNRQRAVQNDLDDHLYDQVRGEAGIELDTTAMDDLITQVVQIARHRMAGSSA